MLTRQLYYEDCHLSVFSAAVLSCTEAEGGFGVILDATAFYPAGGGQPGDVGTLGGVRVLDTIEADGEILHICEGSLAVGERVEGRLDYARRFHYMQQHTGEHMVSGLLHARYGCHNTGFHMGAEGIVIDFDALIPPEDLPELEALANAWVWKNVPLDIRTPDPETLANSRYRTKRQLPWPVRLVAVPGVDTCACCGVHCGATGEVGLIKLFSSVPFRGGSRLVMACGNHALTMLNTAYDQNKQVSQAFSAKIEETGAAARRMNEVLAQQKYRIGELERQNRDFIAKSYREAGDVLHFEPGLDSTGVRELAEAISRVCGGRAAVFSGSDQTGYSFCLAQPGGDLRSFTKEMLSACKGRGGGKPGFQQGSVKTEEAAIRKFFRDAQEG